MSVPSRAPAAYEVRVAEDPVDREACFAVRKDVFVAEQKVPEDIEYDAYDADAVHVLAVREDGVPLGTGRLLHGAAAAAKNGDGDPAVGSPCARRRTPWDFTNVWGTRHTDPSSRTPGFRTARCGEPCSRGGERAGETGRVARLRSAV